VIFGINFILVFGLLNLLLIVFQLLSGFRIVKVTFSMHRKCGFVLCVLAFCHGALAFLVS